MLPRLRAKRSVGSERLWTVRLPLNGLLTMRPVLFEEPRRAEGALPSVILLEAATGLSRSTCASMFSRRV